MSLYQTLPPLDGATEAALRGSVERFGVVLPVVVDSDGTVLDGHHRARIAREVGTTYSVLVVFEGDRPPDGWDRRVRDEHPGCTMVTRQVPSLDPSEIARTLNVDRRHLDPDQRRRHVAVLRGEGHSLRAIAGTVGVSQTQVASDLKAELSTGLHLAPEPPPDRVRGTDGKSYPATRPRPEPADDIFDDGYWSHVEAGLDTSPRRSRRSRRTHLAAAEAKLPGGERSWDDIVGLVHADFGRGGRKNYPPEHVARRAAVALVEGIDGLDGRPFAGIDGRDRAAIVGELHKARSTLSKIIRSLETS